MRDFDVRRITHAEAKPFIVRWHYSKSCPTGFNIFFGAYIKEELYAVADYGVGANMDRGASVARLTRLPVRFLDITSVDSAHRSVNTEGLTVGPRNCLELKRLCRQGEKGLPTLDRANSSSRIPLTRFLSICHKMLKREDGVEYIISYSDPGELTTECVDGKWMVVTDPSKNGGIYRAANFEYLGPTEHGSHSVREATGEVIHRRTPYREMKRWNANHPDDIKTVADIRKERGLVTISTPPKERWFLKL